MRLLIYGHNIKETTKLAQKAGFETVKNNPDIVAVVGGDGTLMKSEKDFPEIPKFILNKNKTTKKGHDISPEEILKKIIKKQYKIEEEIKIEAIFKKQKIVGLNEIIVHNIDPRRAIRYEIFINGKKASGEIIGDGVAVSTPYGSTGYYKSITDSFFEVGLGIAFNNSTERSDHMVLKEDSEIKIRILRGPAMAYADNNKLEIPLNDGEEIVVSKSKDIACLIKLL